MTLAHLEKDKVGKLGDGVLDVGPTAIDVASRRMTAGVVPKLVARVVHCYTEPSKRINKT